ncbi:uncharacterized protein LOC123908107 [Trifolium pratense]|uniref:uncharacterized protein LOC123908107 n=1 Tax=Trifolium pratense TaxID=57577 RepID=UPI001E69525C|nr:uncharacterized protein LOC123908107 [Trifolium pratense]
MGGCYSCNNSSILKNNIRVIHLNGFVEEFDQPISANQVIGNPPTHFVCTSIQLLSSSSIPLLKGDSQLQPGQLYFMLPYSILQDGFSPLDLASLAKRLTAKAKTKPSDYNKSSIVTPLLNQTGFWNSPSRSPCRVGEEEKKSMMNGGRSPCRMQSWKPILESIAEKSLNRRSESDLQELMINV